MARTTSVIGTAAIVLLITATTTTASDRTPDAAGRPRVRINRTADAAAVTQAVLGAARRLEQDECRRIFTDFADAAGRPLQAGLQALDVSAPAYLHVIGFYDGSAQRRCEKSNVLAFTTPGYRTVFVCPSFTRVQLTEPATAELVVLHEILHTLGLGENPPTSAEITRRVGERCGRESR